MEGSLKSLWHESSVRREKLKLSRTVTVGLQDWHDAQEHVFIQNEFPKSQQKEMQMNMCFYQLWSCKNPENDLKAIIKKRKKRLQ